MAKAHKKNKKLIKILINTVIVYEYIAYLTLL